MTAAIKEYSGLPFDLAIGEVYGLRLWKIDKYGRLRARNWSAAGPWRPGTNEAECLAEDTEQIQRVIDPTGKGRRAVQGEVRRENYPPLGSISQLSYSTSSVSFRITWDDGTTEVYPSVEYRKADDQKHPAPSEDCTCGFYAYTEPDHHEVDGYDPGYSYVLGIIKGTGRTLIGTKGFRCEKAEIVALLDPTSLDTDPGLGRQKKLLERVYNVPLLPSRAELLEFAPIESLLPDPSTDEFWSLP